MNKQAIRDSFVRYALEVEGEHGETWWSLPDHMVDKFAHAIAEKMGKVAWKKVVQMERCPDNPDDLAGWSDEYDGDYIVYILAPHDGIEEGNEYTVTVTKEEGDGQGVD